MVFVDVMRIHIVRVIEVTLGEGLGDYTSCGCKIVEKCSDDREIKDKLITFCGFSRKELTLRLPSDPKQGSDLPPE